MQTTTTRTGSLPGDENDDTADCGDHGLTYCYCECYGCDLLGHVAPR